MAVPSSVAGNVLTTVGMTYFRSALAAKQDKGRHIAALHQMAENIEANVLALEQQRSRRRAGELHEDLRNSPGAHGSGASA
jgi:hypothetical protein